PHPLRFQFVFENTRRFIRGVRRCIERTSMIYDLLLQGGQVVDPAHKLNAVRDIAIKDGRVASIAETIAPSSAKQVISARGMLVTPGLIDTHAHVFEYVTGRFGLEADMCGVDSGVTTLIDQGGPSCMTFPAFTEYV